jgi:hypothetical protein
LGAPLCANLVVDEAQRMMTEAAASLFRRAPSVGGGGTRP